MTSSNLKAVIFDIGGVVCKSPLLAIAAYEKSLNLPENYINCSITASGRQGAWQQFERGEIALRPFYEAFSRELSDAGRNNVWYKAYCERKNMECPPLPSRVAIDGRELFGRMMRTSQSWDDNVVEAIRRIRETRRYRVIALTNNYAAATEGVDDKELAFLGWQNGSTPAALKALFDDYCDSSTLGMRKPEPEFYLLACRRNNIEPHEAIFLDDLGMNLKAARALGMETIHVPIGGSLGAVRELGIKLGVDLISGGAAGPPGGAKL